MPIELITELDFESKVIRSDLPVLMCLCSDRSESCKKLEPIFQELSAEYEGALKVVKVEIERNPRLAQALHGQ